MKIFKNTSLTCIALLAALSAMPCPGAENSVPAPVRPSERISSWLAGMSRTYDDWIVNQESVHVTDVYTWIYNASFARDFRMPDRWLDDSLKGADALAFRVKPSFPLCGWNGNPESCKPINYCLVEIYFNHKAHPLPWNDRLRWTDLQVNLTSAWMLSAMQPLKRDASATTGRRSPFADPKTGGELDWWFSTANGRTSANGPVWHAYDRSAFPGYGILVLDIGCPEEEVTGLELRLADSSVPSTQLFHALSFPTSWRDRIKPLLQKAAEENRSFRSGRAHAGQKSGSVR